MEQIFRIELNMFGLLIAAIVIILFLQQIRQRKKEDKIFMLLCILTVIELVLDTAFWIVDGNEFRGGRYLNLAINYFYYAIQIIVCYIWMEYCIAHVTVKFSRAWHMILSSFMIVGIILLVANIPTNIVFSVSANNIYNRSWGVFGWMEALCCLFYPCCTFCIVVSSMLRGGRKEKREGIYLLFVTIVPVVSSIIQMYVYGLNFIWVGMATALLLVLVEIETKQYHSMQNKIMEQRNQMMLSQIQPHFLYNCLSTIENMCDIDVNMAKSGIYHFARYLRSNLDSLQEDNIIRFEQELVHIESFLTLEKMQLGEDLKVEYDLEITDFVLPSLTVQPIVENAVRYGVGKKEEGGTVIIQTKDLERMIEIVVKDDGVGFDMNKPHSDGRSHVGLQNVRRRLQSQVDGTLNVDSNIGLGTTVIIRIPKGGYGNEGNRSR